MEFSTNPFGEISCPACGSFPRTRAMMFYLRRHLDERRPNRVLHIAPFWKKAEALSRIDGLTYITADMAWPGEGVYPWNSMMRMNMEDIPFADGFFDLVIAVSVMQFILRDGRAFSEVARVLRPGGVFVFELDVFGDRTEESYSDKELDVLEYGIKDGPVELFMTGKWKKDGKLLHDPRQYVRKYGMDIMDRAARAGFAVRQADLERFAPLERYGIRTSPHIFECTRTGSRT
jgi:SAM-dependent methyltransferase